MDRFETVADESVTKPEFRQMTVEAKYNYASHLFANEIKTDGYNASILYYRPKKDEPKRGEDDLLVSAGYLPDVVIGPDPGMRSVCTAAHQYLRPQAPRRPKQRRVRRPRRQKKKNKKRKRNFPKWIRRPKALRLGQRPGREIVSVTTREYRHLAGFNRFRAWNKSQKRKFPEYKKVFDGMPSFKTASYEQYLKRLEYFWQHATYLVQFWKDRPYLKWRFFQKRMARVAVDTLARRIVPTPKRWHQGPRSEPGQEVERGTAEARDGGFHGRVQTSKLCSQCRQSLSSVQYPTPVFPKNGDKPKRKKVKGKVLPRDWSQAGIQSRHCRVVLLCENKICQARYWDRDVNATINMLELLKSEVQGRGRIQPFKCS
ncbi:hypothetical protein L916_10791 [Phytophthora nicotianae]|uniref:Uncharacterized protein n=1 Tax=Phytophthora nicotianae TaxID=4792 RepID=W2IVF0_PHYNI|nr:hypothetical protein L916_10791 [Phytophthora nicotianae]